MLKKLKVFVLISCAMVLMCCAAGCSAGQISTKTLKGDGNITTVESALTEGSYQVLIEDILFESDSFAEAKLIIDEKVGDTAAITTDHNIADTIKIVVDNDAKKITVKGDKSIRYSTETFSIQIGVPVDNIQIDGGFLIDLNIPSVSEYKMLINGACDGEISVGELDGFTLEINGASNIAVAGKSINSEITINGASNITAFDFETENTSIAINGASNCEVFVSNTLTAKINGLGKVTYAGEPATVDKTVAGLGSVNEK